MSVQQLYEGMSREEWGKKNIGGSDLAPILGKSNYKTALDLFFEKTGQKPNDAPTRMMVMGTRLEADILGWASEEIQKPIKSGRMFRDSEYPYLAGNTDGEIDEETMVEIKTMDFRSRDKWGEQNTDEIPVDYYLQVMWYMGLGGYKRCVVIRFDRGTCEIAYYLVEFQPDLFAECRKSAVRFMENMRNGIAPEPTAKDGDNIVYLFPKGNEEILIADDTIDAIATEMGAIYPDLKSLERQYDNLKSQMQVAIGPNKGIETLCGKFTMTRVPGRTSWQKVAAELHREWAEKEGETHVNPIFHQIVSDCTGNPSLRLNTPFKESK